MSTERLSEFPNIPTLRESNIDWTCVGWRGLAVPVGTPPKIESQLRQITEQIARSSEFAEFMKAQGFGIEIRVGDQFREFLEDQDTQWAVVTHHYRNE